MKVSSNGTPHIAYTVKSSRAIKIARAAAANTTSWTVVDGPPGAPVVSLALEFIVGTSEPLIGYGVLGETNAEKNLLLSKATDAMASGWNTPLVVQVDDSNVFNGTYAGYTTLANINSIPTIIWNDIQRGWVILRQTTSSAATALSAANFFIVDQGSFNQPI